MLLEVHPKNPSPRHISQIVEKLKSGAIIIFPTDSVYALGCALSNTQGIERVCRIMGKKPEKANLSLLCRDLKHLADFAAQISNALFRLMRQVLPGPYTFILMSSPKVPKLFNASSKRTVGIRVPDHPVTQAILEALGEPLVSGSIHGLQGHDDYLTEPWEMEENFGHLVDIVVDAGTGGIEVTTILDGTGQDVLVIREGKGSLEGL